MGVARLFAALLFVVGCGEPTVDWTAPEDFLFVEKASKTDTGVKLEYWSLVDAPAGAVYAALADVEHYPDFVPGVNRVQVLAVGEQTKTVQIAQQVISQQTNAKVEWTFHPAERRIEFRTLQSNLAYNDGSYKIEPSPDGTRCLVRTVFLVREGEGGTVPVGVLTSATREAFLAAAGGVKRRATGAAS